MKTNLRIVLIIGVSSLLLAYRAKKTIDYATINIHILDKKVERIEVSTPSLFALKPVLLMKTKCKENGNKKIALHLKGSLFVGLQVGEYYTTLLLSPGDNVQVVFDAKATNNPFSYLGKGSEPANYIYKSSLIWNKYEQIEGYQLMTLEPQDFIKHLYIIQNKYNKLYKEYQKNSIIPEAILYLLEQKNKMQLLSLKLNYIMTKFNPDDPSRELIPILNSFYKEVPFRPNFLKVNMYEYGLVLNYYVQSALLEPFIKVKNKNDLLSLQEQLPILVDEQIIKNKYPSSIQTFLRSKNLQLFLKQQGLTSATNSLLRNIKSEPEYTFYEPTITENYTNWQELIPGKKAPDFSGITPDGNILSINSLIGKVVYIDVWATWCVPCREEMPYAKKLQKHFADNDRVAFLYISIDRNEEVWRKLLANDNTFKGIHINQPPGQMFEHFSKAYQLSSIPRYILIDQAGKLVDVNAAHPSSDKLEAIIEKLLN